MTANQEAWRIERRHENEPNREGDRRTPAQRDRDRILHSEALRRLANVTQVVDPGEGHVFHNRLTHTLKVAQIARRLAEKLILDQPDEAHALNIDPDVAEAAALAHDLGHPPFGHIAEKELDRLVRSQDLADGYEGNPQSFRILTKLEVRIKSTPGLDLTRATLNAVMKYPRLRQLDGEGNKKWGAYSTERNDFLWARTDLDNSDLRSVEAELMDWADDIAFSVHDVEDFYRAGLIPPIIFSKELPPIELHVFVGEVLKRWQRDQGRASQDSLTVDQLSSVCQQFLPLLPFSEPFKNTREKFADIRTTTSTLIDRYIRGIQINSAAVKDPRERTVIINVEYRTEIRLLKELTWRYVIHNRALATQQFGKQKIIKDLFVIFLAALNAVDGEAKFILPEDYEKRLAAIDEDLQEADEQIRERQAKARLVADIISSMTDNEAISMYKRLKGFDPGSVLQRMPG